MDILSLIAERSRPAPTPAPITLPSALDLIAKLTGKSIEELQALREAEPEGEQSTEEVEDTAELRRVFALPRRSIDFAGAEIAALAQSLTEAFKTPQGTMRLKPIQAAALAEIYTVGGLVGPIRVGGGKTLITYLAPMMQSIPSVRPILIVPAALRKKTYDSFTDLAQHWKGPHPDTYRIVSYEELGRVKAGSKLSPQCEKCGSFKTEPDKTRIRCLACGRTGEAKLTPGLLDKYRPTTLVLDEAHKAKNPRAACTRRILRYCHENPSVRLIILSGTLFRRSLKDFGPLTLRSLGKLAPVPDSYTDLEAWSGALDEKVHSLRRVQPGPLVELCTKEERATGPDLDSLRSAYGRRFYMTPGVVASKEEELGTSILFRELRVAKPDPKIDAHFAHFRATWGTPQGITVPDGKEFKRHALEMALGFEYYWDPGPPDDWKEIRKQWFRIVRYVLKHNRRNLDSEAQAVKAVEAGLYPGLDVLKEWRKIEPTFKPNTVSAWFSSEAVDLAAHWAEREKGLVWVSHTAFALALSKHAKLPYYGRQGKTDGGIYIMDAPKGKPAIASVESNKLGRDLQYHWHTNLVISPMADGLTWEQLAARTHRDGQPEDEVTIDRFSNSTEHLANWQQALRDASAQERITGQPQKLCYGDKEDMEPPDTELGRWGQKEDIPDA